MEEPIDITVNVRVKKGTKPTATALRKEGGALAFIPKEFDCIETLHNDGQGVDDTISTYIFRHASKK